MLSLTRRTGYGLIAMVHLAALPEGELLSAREMAGRTGASPSLLMKVLKDLAGGGYVESVRGARGGYRLVREPSQINLAQLVDYMEGPVRLAECVVSPKRSGEDANCRMVARCPIVGPIQLVQEKLSEVLASVTLADMVERASQPAGP